MIRLNTLLAKKGICSRREANYYIQHGMVLVNDKIIKARTFLIDEEEEKKFNLVQLTPEGKTHVQNKISIIFHKPTGIVSSKGNHGYITARDMLTNENQWIIGPNNSNNNIESILLPSSINNNNNNNNEQIHTNKNNHNHGFNKSLHLCGRLDINTSGLLFFTQDGTLAKQITTPSTTTTTTIEKEYYLGVKKHNVAQAWVDKCIQDCHSHNILNHIKSLQILNPYQLKLIVVAGGDDPHHPVVKNCDIELITQKADFKLNSMKLVRIGNLGLNCLPTGTWRYFIHGKDAI